VSEGRILWIAGLDYRVASGTVVGFALAGGGTGWSLAQNLGSGGSDAFQAGVYATTRAGPFYLAGALAYTQHWMSTDRFALVVSPRLTSIAGRSETPATAGAPGRGLMSAPHSPNRVLPRRRGRRGRSRSAMLVRRGALYARSFLA
jgi:hypothetical protein